MPFSLIDSLNEIVDRLPLFKVTEVLSVCIDEHSIRMIEINVSGNKPTIKNFAVVQLPQNMNAEEQGSIILKTVEETYQKGGFKSKHVFVTIISGSVFLRKVQLPNMPKAEVENAIKWEADNQIPFSIDSAYLDWQFLTKERSKEGIWNNIYMIAASNKQPIDNIIDLFKKTSLDLVCVGIPPFAIESALKQYAPMRPDEDFAFIDIGVRKTNIIIFCGKVLSFAREVPVGYNTLDDILYTELPALRAKSDRNYIETLKKACDSIALAHAEKELIPGVPNQRICSSFSLFMERLISEMTRSLDYYKTQAGDFNLGRIYVSGIGSQIKRIDEYIQNKFDVPVDFIDPKEKLDFHKSVNQETFLEHFQQLLILVGSALAGFNQINFHPAKFQEKVRSRIYAIGLCGFFVLCLLVWIGLGIFGHTKVRSFEKQIEERKATFIGADAELSALKVVCEKASENLEIYKSFFSEQRFLSPVLKELSARTPDYITFKKVSFQDGRLRIEGYVFSDEERDITKENAIVDFVISLTASRMIREAKLISSDKGTELDVDYNTFIVECTPYTKDFYLSDKG